MSKEIGPYNTDLHLFPESTPVNKGRLLFMRWLGVNNLLEHPIAGPAQGDLALAITAQDGRGALTPMSKSQQLQKLTLRQWTAQHGDY